MRKILETSKIYLNAVHIFLCTPALDRELLKSKKLGSRSVGLTETSHVCVLSENKRFSLFFTRKTSGGHPSDRSEIILKR